MSIPTGRQYAYSFSCFGEYPADFFRETIGSLFYSLFQNSFEPSRESPFATRLKEVKTTVSNETSGSAYSQIKAKIVNANSARDLFGIPAGDRLDRSTILKVYRKTVTLVHPDKNPNNEMEASLLFHCVQEAYEELNTDMERSATQPEHFLGNLLVFVNCCNSNRNR
ncbi:MAG: J domain-containing protein [Parachlamydiaceae bacterium]